MYVRLAKEDQQRSKCWFLRRILSEKRRSLLTSERPEKKPIDVLSLCCAPRVEWREIRRDLMEIGAEFVLSGKSHSDNFSLFIPKICSTLFKQNTSRSTHRFSTTMQWQDLLQKNRLKKPRFLLRRKEKIFSSFEYFYPKRKRWKDLFISTHWDRSKTVEEKQFSRSFKFAATEKSTNRRWKSQWKWEKKNEGKTPFEKENFTILEEKIRVYWIKRRRKDAALHSVFKCLWYVGIWFLFGGSVEFFDFFSFEWSFSIQSFVFFPLNISFCFVAVSGIDAFFLVQSAVWFIFYFL